MLKSIEQEWQGFSEMVFRNKKPSMIQISEMRKAFFAGAWAMVTSFREIGEPHISEDEGVAYLEARWKECEEFKNRLTAEYSGEKSHGKMD